MRGLDGAKTAICEFHFGETVEPFTIKEENKSQPGAKLDLSFTITPSKSPFNNILV